jgi:hypothetical protein
MGRASSDKICNSRGAQMLEFCKATSLHIANGRIGNDYNIGEHTCMYYTTFNYLDLSKRDFPLIDSFSVLPFNLYSDHEQITLSLK